MRFEVRAATPEGHMTALQLEATDMADARGQALRLRLTPVSVHPAPAGPRRNSKFDLPLFAEELQILLEAGLPLVDCIQGLAEREGAKDASQVLSPLAMRLREGDRLSTAMRLQPDAFSPLFIGIVQSAESTSDYAATLSRFVAHEAHVRKLRERLTSAAIYPCLLLLVGFCVGFFLLVYVVPKFAAVYQGAARQLPMASQWLMDLGVWLNHNLGLLSGVAVMIFCALLFAYRIQRSKVTWLGLLAAVPGLARHANTIELSRLYRTLGMLIQGGVPVREALSLSGSVLMHRAQASVVSVRKLVEGGSTLSAALAKTALATPLALRLIQVGEGSGSLGIMLERAALFHEHETAQWIERFSKAFAPLLMILISFVVGGIVIALYIPIFDLAAGFR